MTFKGFMISILRCSIYFLLHYILKHLKYQILGQEVLIRQYIVLLHLNCHHVMFLNIINPMLDKNVSLKVIHQKYEYKA